MSESWIMYIFTVCTWKSSESIFEETVDKVEINVKVLKCDFYENYVFHQNCEIFHGAYIFIFSFFGK